MAPIMSTVGALEIGAHPEPFRSSRRTRRDDGVGVVAATAGAPPAEIELQIRARFQDHHDPSVVEDLAVGETVA